MLVVATLSQVAAKLGPPVAKGNTSTVYRWGQDAVAKVLDAGIPEQWVAREAETTELVYSAGLPAPRVRDVTRVGGRPAIVFDRIDGPSMWVVMRERRDEVLRLSRLLADLQAEVNATPAPSGLASLNDHIRTKVESARCLPPLDRAATLVELEQLPRRKRLCHFDVHPNNVLMASRGPILIDWFDAAAGCPEADVVRSSVLMRPVAARAYLECTDSSLIREAHDEYLRRVMCTRPELAGRLLDWERPVLASRLAEPLDDAIRLDMLHDLRRLRLSEPTPLAIVLSSPSSGSSGSSRNVHSGVDGQD